jgi:hypothetical protein
VHLGISHVSLRRAALFGWPSVGVLQMFKCATCQIQQAPCTTAPARAAYNGPGRLGEWNPSSGNRWGSSSRYGASLRRENGQIIRRFQSRVFSASLGLDRAFCSEPSCGSARSGWLPSSASSRL